MAVEQFELMLIPFLLDRAGGHLEYTEPEYQAVLAKHGGKARMNLRAEVTRTGDGPETVELRLEEKAPGQGDLMSARLPPDPWLVAPAHRES